MVESANKLVVEARLKGAGMHWERNHVNPLLALRNGVCNQRWQETWHLAVAHQHAQHVQGRTTRAEQRKQAKLSSADPLLQPASLHLCRKLLLVCLLHLQQPCLAPAAHQLTIPGKEVVLALQRWLQKFKGHPISFSGLFFLTKSRMLSVSTSHLETLPWLDCLELRS